MTTNRTQTANLKPPAAPRVETRAPSGQHPDSKDDQPGDTDAAPASSEPLELPQRVKEGPTGETGGRASLAKEPRVAPVGRAELASAEEAQLAASQWPLRSNSSSNLDLHLHLQSQSQSQTKSR